MKNIYIQHQINTLILQIQYIRQMKAKNSRNACTVVAITGPTGSGKSCFCQHICPILKKRISPTAMELIPVEVVRTSQLSSALFNELASNTFVSIFLVTCRSAEKSDVSLEITGFISPSKLHKTLNITMARLKAIAYNFNLALRNDTIHSLSNTQILSILASQLYTKRCTSDIHLIANDLDYVSYLTDYSQYPDMLPVISSFLDCRPHVNTAFRSHIPSVESNPEPVLKESLISQLQIQFQNLF